MTGFWPSLNFEILLKKEDFATSLKVKLDRKGNKKIERKNTILLQIKIRDVEKQKYKRELLPYNKAPHPAAHRQGKIFYRAQGHTTTRVEAIISLVGIKPGWG